MSAILNELHFSLRPMVQGDMPRILQIEKAVYPFYWSEAIFDDCLRVGYCCWVCCIEDEVIGYGVMSFAVGEAHILNLCIDTGWQRQGLGRMLLNHLFSLAMDHHADTVFLEVRKSNASAQRLYESEGFVEIDQRYNYYPAAGNSREDAIIYARSLI